MKKRMLSIIVIRMIAISSMYSQVDQTEKQKLYYSFGVSAGIRTQEYTYKNPSTLKKIDTSIVREFYKNIRISGYYKVNSNFLISVNYENTLDTQSNLGIGFILNNNSKKEIIRISGVFGENLGRVPFVEYDKKYVNNQKIERRTRPTGFFCRTSILYINKYIEFMLTESFSLNSNTYWKSFITYQIPIKNGDNSSLGIGIYSDKKSNIGAYFDLGSNNFQSKKVLPGKGFVKIGLTNLTEKRLYVEVGIHCGLWTYE